MGEGWVWEAADSVSGCDCESMATTMGGNLRVSIIRPLLLESTSLIGTGQIKSQPGETKDSTEELTSELIKRIYFCDNAL